MFLKECKKVLFSLTFILLIIAVFAMYFTQFGNDIDSPEYMPIPNDDGNYGYIAKEIPEKLMPNAAQGLVSEYLSGEFQAYPVGFVKYVKLTEKKKTQMAEIIKEITGIAREELDNFQNFDTGGMLMTIDENGNPVDTYQEPVMPEINIPETLSYEHFRDLMREADKIIGGGSAYSDDNIVGNFSLVSKTYEDALAEYNAFINDDKITGAYARLFCDYMGIIFSVLPVFVAAAFVTLDKKARISDLIYSRKISSAKLIFTRFLSLVFMMIIPLLITVLIANLKVSSLYPDSSVDIFAIPKLALFWIVPNIMIFTALGMFLTELSSALIAVVVGGAWWITSVMSAKGLAGNINLFTLVCRHNSLYSRNLFMDDLDKFIFNRVFYVLLAVALTALTAVLYNIKRKGGLGGHSKNSESKSAV